MTKRIEQYLTPVQLKQADHRRVVRNMYLQGLDVDAIGLHTRRHPSQIRTLIRRFEKELSRQKVADVESLRKQHRVRLDKLLSEYYQAAENPENLIPALNGVRGTLGDIMKLEGTATPVTQVIEQDVNISGNMLLSAIAPSTGLPSQGKVIEHES